MLILDSGIGYLALNQLKKSNRIKKSNYLINNLF